MSSRDDLISRKNSPTFLVENNKTRCPKYCQHTKHSAIKYRPLPEKVAETNPWDIFCVDMIGPSIFQINGKKALTLWCVIMIDPATSWFETKQVKVKGKEAITVATRYPWPTQVIFDKGKEFLGEFTAMVPNEYGVERKCIAVRIVIIEQIHQTIANISLSFEVQKNHNLDPDDPWSGILAATMFAVIATNHTTLQATPSQLVKLESDL
jgi:hypothetical protein